jgi:hypothetical protein
MEEGLNQNTSCRIYPCPEFVYVNAIDVGRCVGKLYYGTKKSDKKNRPKLIASFIHLLSYIKDWESEYSNKYISVCCGLKFPSQVSYYKRKHIKLWTNERYRFRMKLAIDSLSKLETRKRNKFKNRDHEQD